MKYFAMIWLFFTAQFGIGYHCIYNVEWLGWDLVEPLTYTIGQGLFIGGMVFMLKKGKKLQNVNYIDLQNYYVAKNMSRLKMLESDIGLLDPKRRQHVASELARVRKQVEELERQKIF